MCALKINNDCREAWNDLAGEKSGKTWMTTTITNGELVLVATGDQRGLEGLREHLADAEHEKKVLFAMLRVLAVDDRHKDVISRRVKWIYSVFEGAKVSPMQRFAKHKASTVQEELFGHMTCRIDSYGLDLDSFDMETIGDKILTIGGAHKPVYYEFGEKQRLNLTQLLGADAACLQSKGASITNK